MAEAGTTNDLTVKKIVFECIIKGTDLEKKPELMEEIKPFYDPENPLSVYSITAAQEMTEILCKRLYPHLPREKALFEIGRQAFQGFYKGTIVGGIMLVAIKVMKWTRLTRLGQRMWQDSGIGKIMVEEIASNTIKAQYRNFKIKAYLPMGVTVEGMKTAGIEVVGYELEELPSSGLYSHNFNVIYSILDKRENAE